MLVPFTLACLAYASLVNDGSARFEVMESATQDADDGVSFFTAVSLIVGAAIFLASGDTQRRACWSLFFDDDLNFDDSNHKTSTRPQSAMENQIAWKLWRVANWYQNLLWIALH